MNAREGHEGAERASTRELDMRELLARILEPLARALDTRQRALVPVPVDTRHPQPRRYPRG